MRRSRNPRRSSIATLAREVAKMEDRVLLATNQRPDGVRGPLQTQRVGIRAARDEESVPSRGIGTLERLGIDKNDVLAPKAGTTDKE